MESCTHRRCVIPKLLVLFKMASENAPGMIEDDVLRIGLRGLQIIGVSEQEIEEATFYLLSSPFMGDVDHDPTVTTGNGEHSER